MKALLLVLFAFSATFNVPAPCAHALGLAGGHASVHADMKAGDDGATLHNDEQAADMHAHHEQHAPQTDHIAHAPQSHTDTHQGCEEECNGGANCNGCFMTTGAVETNASIAKPPLAASVLAFANTLADSAAPGAEPPPPRV